MLACLYVVKLLRHLTTLCLPHTWINKTLKAITVNFETHAFMSVSALSLVGLTYGTFTNWLLTVILQLGYAGNLVNF